ncbi:DUF1127 domain-containing protein [Roseibium sp. MMSF_3544]|uniref:DUF1127 domain-containing protein n=1 Tax=unclassified Roseibium TaxID=2629323 RepID=UPI00274009DD|nr:DUF1127 domain-containing protein [Roseibium sp. MMSF_3544]
METVTYSLKFDSASLPRRLKFLTFFDALKRFFRLRIASPVQRLRTATDSVVEELADIGKERHAIKTLSQMSDYELADIGLSRSDLTSEGLAVAGAKRALKQDSLVREIALTRSTRGAIDHGN